MVFRSHFSFSIGMVVLITMDMKLNTTIPKNAKCNGILSIKKLMIIAPIKYPH